MAYGPSFWDVGSSKCRQRFPAACRTSIVPATLVHKWSLPHCQEAVWDPLPSSRSHQPNPDCQTVCIYLPFFLS